MVDAVCWWEMDWLAPYCCGAGILLFPEVVAAKRKLLPTETDRNGGKNATLLGQQPQYPPPQIPSVLYKRQKPLET